MRRSIEVIPNFVDGRLQARRGLALCPDALRARRGARRPRLELPAGQADRRRARDLRPDPQEDAGAPRLRRRRPRPLARRAPRPRRRLRGPHGLSRQRRRDRDPPAGRKLFLLPSDAESFGLAALEAMACGVPVIGDRRRAACPEVVEDGVTGFLRPVGDVDGMAEAGSRFWTIPRVGPLFSAAARKRAVEVFPTEVDRRALPGALRKDPRRALTASSRPNDPGGPAGCAKVVALPGFRLPPARPRPRPAPPSRASSGVPRRDARRLRLADRRRGCGALPGLGRRRALRHGRKADRLGDRVSWRHGRRRRRRSLLWRNEARKRRAHRAPTARAAARALESAGARGVYDVRAVVVTCAYGRLGAIKRLVRPPEIAIVSEEFGQETKVTLAVRRSLVDSLCTALDEARIVYRVAED